MKLLTLRRHRKPELPGIKGSARVDRRTKSLCKRVKPGDIAVIDHIDLDRTSAEALVAAGVAAVVNTGPSISGRYPNLGPGVLVEAGIPLVDSAGEEVHGLVSDGDQVRLDGKILYRGDRIVAEGVEQTSESIAAALEEARQGLSTQLEAFAANTTEYLRREHDLLLDGVGIPDLDTDLQGKHVLLVTAGHDHQAELSALRSYIRDYRPVLVGVDAGADTIVNAGLDPDIIVGDMDAVSDSALRSGAELVVHAYRDGRAPGMDRLERLGLQPVVFTATGTSEDIALLLADAGEASLIVTAGTHGTLVEFLDKGRSGMASTFLTRLRVGGKLVDAKSVARLYRHRIHTWQVVVALVVALLALAVALAATPVGQEWYGVALDWLRDGYAWGRGLVS